MPKLCGTPETPFEVKVVEDESHVPRATRWHRKVARHAEGCRDMDLVVKDESHLPLATRWRRKIAHHADGCFWASAGDMRDMGDRPKVLGFLHVIFEYPS